MLRGAPALVAVAATVVIVPFAFAASSPVAGTYDTTLVGSPVALLNAKWELKLTGSGAYTLLRNGKDVVHGTTIVSKSTIAFQDEDGSLACVGTQTVGNYRWAFFNRGGRRLLLLELKNDPCQGRKSVLLAGALRKLK